MDPTKTQGVADWPRPTNVTDVRSFLGFTSFYQYFIPNYSKIAKPLLLLTRKDTPWHWDVEQKQAFEHLKTSMCQRPVLAQPNYNKPFVVHTNASASSAKLQKTCHFWTLFITFQLFNKHTRSHKLKVPESGQVV